MKTRARRAKSWEADVKPKAASKKPKAKRKPSKNDRDKPKKPPTAFFYFLDYHADYNPGVASPSQKCYRFKEREDFRKAYQQENPDVKSMRDIGKACGEKWNTMTYEEKVAYYDIATEKRAEFEKAIAEYTKREESGECTEESDESI